MSELLCNCNNENKTENNKNQFFQSQVEEQLNLTTKFRLWIIRNWVNCSHKLNTNETKSRKNPFELFIKAEEGTKLNISLHWVNFDQKLNCQSQKCYSNRIKTRQLKHWLNWSQEKKHLNQVEATSFHEISVNTKEILIAMMWNWHLLYMKLLY